MTVDLSRDLARTQPLSKKKSCCPETALASFKTRRRRAKRSVTHQHGPGRRRGARCRRGRTRSITRSFSGERPSNASNDNELIKALERERDAALDARDAAEEARAKAERQLSQSIDSVKDGAKGALSQLQKDAKTNEAAAVKKAVDDVKVEAKKKIAAVKEKLKAVQDFAKKRDEECKAAEAKLAQAEASRTTALDDVKAQLRHAQTQRDDALRQARTPVVAAPVPVPQKGDDARLRAALEPLSHDNERDANARLRRADFRAAAAAANKVLRARERKTLGSGSDAAAKAADRAAFDKLPPTPPLPLLVLRRRQLKQLKTRCRRRSRSRRASRTPRPAGGEAKGAPRDPGRAENRPAAQSVGGNF